MLTLLVKLFNALNSESSPRQIALAIVLGLIVGAAPLVSLHAWLVLFIVLMIRVHLGSFILSVGVFSAISYLLSWPIVILGEYLLTLPELQAFFVNAYQYDLFKLAHLHHTYTLGALVLACGLAVPLYFINHWLIVKYRQHIKAFFEKMRLVKALKASKFYRLYTEVSAPGLNLVGDK